MPDAVPLKDVEQLKENLAPRAEGYDIRRLFSSAERSTTPSTHDPVQEEESEAYAEDPLLGHVQEMASLEDLTPQVTMTPKLIELMATCIDRFKSWDMYKNDVRFVRLCLRYGSFSESPPMMFDFMNSYDIGKSCAVFYLQWANYLETVRDVTAAQKVVKQGIRAEAQPIALLKQLDNDLERRCNGLKRKAVDPVPAQIASKHYRLDIYTGDSDDNSDEDAISDKEVGEKKLVPRISIEKKENKQAAEPLIKNSHPVLSSIRRLQAYHDDPNDLEEHSTDDEGVNEISFAASLLANRRFQAPVRAFANVIRPMLNKVSSHHGTACDSGSAEVTGSKLSSVINQQHEGKTELLGKRQLNNVGDTEILN